MGAILRKRPGVGRADFWRRWSSDIASSIQHRRAAMTLAALPKATESELWLCGGGEFPPDSLEQAEQHDWQDTPPPDNFEFAMEW